MVPNGYYQQQLPHMGHYMPPVPSQPMGHPAQFYVMEQQLHQPPQQITTPAVNRVVRHGTDMSSSSKSSDKPVLRKTFDGYFLIDRVQIIPLGDRAELPTQEFLNGATTPGNFRLKIYGRSSGGRWVKLGELDYEETGAKELIITSREPVNEIEFVGDFMSLSFIVFGEHETRRSSGGGNFSPSIRQQSLRDYAERGASEADRFLSASASRDDHYRNKNFNNKRAGHESDEDDRERLRESDSKKRRKGEREQRLYNALRQLQRNTEMRVKNNIGTNKFVPLVWLTSSLLPRYVSNLPAGMPDTLTDVLSDLRSGVRKHLLKSRLPAQFIGVIAAKCVVRLNSIAPQAFVSSATDSFGSAGDHHELKQFGYFLLRYTSIPRVDMYGTGSISMYNDLFRIAVYRLTALLVEDGVCCRLLLSMKVIKWLSHAVTDDACVMVVKQAAFEAMLQMLVQPEIVQQFLSDGLFSSIGKYMSPAAFSVSTSKSDKSVKIDEINTAEADHKILLLPLYTQLVRMCQLFTSCQEMSDHAAMFDSACSYAVQRNDVSIAARMLDAMSRTMQKVTGMACGAGDDGGGEIVGVNCDARVDLSAAKCLNNYGMLQSVALVMRQLHGFVAEASSPVGKIMKAVADASFLAVNATHSSKTQPYQQSSMVSFGASSNDYNEAGSGGGSVVYVDALAESIRTFVNFVVLALHSMACKQHHVDTLLMLSQSMMMLPATTVNSNNYHCFTEIITCATQIYVDRRLFTANNNNSYNNAASAVVTDDAIVVESQQQSNNKYSSLVPKTLLETIRYSVNIFTLFDQLAQRLFGSQPSGTGKFAAEQSREKADVENDAVIALEIAADLLRLSYDVRYHACLLHTLAHPLIIGLFAKYFAQSQHVTHASSQHKINDINNGDGGNLSVNKGPHAGDNGDQSSTAHARPPPPIARGNNNNNPTATMRRQQPPPESRLSDVKNPLPPSDTPAKQPKLTEAWQQDPMTILLSDMLYRVLKYMTDYKVIVCYAHLLPNVEQVTLVGSLKELTKMLMPYRDFAENVSRNYSSKGDTTQLRSVAVERPQQFLLNTCTRMLGVLDRASQPDMIKMSRLSTALCVRLASDCVHAFAAVSSTLSPPTTLYCVEGAERRLSLAVAQLDSMRILVQCNAVESLCGAVRANCRYALDKNTTMSYERFESLSAIVGACMQVLKRIAMVACCLSIDANDGGGGRDAIVGFTFGYVNDIIDTAIHAYVLCFHNDDENDVMRTSISRDCLTIFSVLVLHSSLNNTKSTKGASGDVKREPVSALLHEEEHGFVKLMRCVAERMDAGERDQLAVMQLVRMFFQLLYEAPTRLFAEFLNFYCGSKCMDCSKPDVVDAQLAHVEHFGMHIRSAIATHSEALIDVFFGSICSRIVYAAYSPKLPIAQGIQRDDSLVARKYKTACLLLCTVMMHAPELMANAVFSRLLRELVEAVDIQPRKMNVSSAIWSLRQIAMLLCAARNSSTLRVVFDDPTADGGSSGLELAHKDHKQQYSIAPADTQSMQKFHQFLSKLDQALRAKAVRLIQEKESTAAAASGAGTEGDHKMSSNMTFASLNDVMQYVRCAAGGRAGADGTLEGAEIDGKEHLHATDRSNDEEHDAGRVQEDGAAEPDISERELQRK